MVSGGFSLVSAGKTSDLAVVAGIAVLLCYCPCSSKSGSEASYLRDDGVGFKKAGRHVILKPAESIRTQCEVSGEKRK